MIPEPQLTDLIQFLARPDSYEEKTTSVAVLQTHISVVALTDQFVYKLKKNVRFDFLDFSTLAKRQYYCQEEVRLNQRLSADLYQGILPIYWDGKTLTFQSGGEVVDYVIQMRRLSDEGLLINQMKDPGFPLHRVDGLIDRLLAFYQNAPSSPDIAAFGTPEIIEATLQEVTGNFFRYENLTLTPLAARWIPIFLTNFLHSHRNFFEERIQLGKIVEGHGDLRSEHIHIENNIITIFDCIEFSQHLRCLDILNDLAFLLMDLDYRHCRTLADYLQEKLFSVQENSDWAPLITFYKTYRACVRGKVDTLKAKEPEISLPVRQESQQKARRYFQLALRYAVLGSQPAILVCMGGAATGKSTLATSLASELGLAVLNSDNIRKQQAGIDPFYRLPESERWLLYEKAVTHNVYKEMASRGLREAQQTGAVILDATYRDQDKLKNLQAICRRKNVRLFVIQTEAPVELIQQRLQQRETQPSVSDLQMSDYVSGQFEITYAIETYVENGLKVNTQVSTSDTIDQEIIPWLIQQVHPALPVALQF
ncbi:AAA family ATPase [Larkinella sp. C7]|jgi:aminoglycoside phosphotransferase family enzyme/predicted kinase|uniref:bifunctional aminoglycoside phosphotransferase/ATP-binding protein n=1 Tax=Larkinella sp. C7 TaxID=2576607 RepID=UPI001111331C|nr:AAA family ATPase [Larkinella sp. C7]